MKNLSGLMMSLISDHTEYYKKIIGVFYRLRNKLPRKCIITLNFAFVYPQLLNDIEIYTNTGSTHLDKLQN